MTYIQSASHNTRSDKFGNSECEPFFVRLFDAPLQARPSRKRLASFFGHVSIVQGSCWTYAPVNYKGYGGFSGTTAHRWAYSWFVGPIPSGYHVDHLCGNRACVNPVHLDAVTLAENNRRGNVWNRTGRCFNGHLITPNTTYWQSKNGRPHRTCLICRKASRRRWKAKVDIARDLRVHDLAGMTS